MATQTHQKPANQSTPSISAANGSTAAKKAPLTDEQKHRLGTELAQQRVSKVLALMKKIGNLGRYGLTDEEIGKIVSAIHTRFEAMKANINQKVVKEEGFTL